MNGETVPLRRETFKKLHRQHNLWRWAFSTLLAAVFVIFVCFVCFQWVKMGNDSMAPTLHEGDLVLVDRIYKYCYKIERTDMVAFRRNGTGEESCRPWSGQSSSQQPTLTREASTLGTRAESPPQDCLVPEKTPS